MKKYRHISSFLIIVSIFVIGGFLFPNTALACEWYEFTCNVMEILLPSVAEFTIRGMSLLTGLAGIILNAVIYYTIVDIANNYSRITTINEAWSVIRDLANMSFIFVLLYAAIKTILGTGSDTKNLIVKIIVVAILINFSLFFTKVVIDASNVLAIAFYDAIVPGAFDDIGVINLVTQTGISHAFMQNLNLQSLYEVGENGNRIGPASIVTLGIMCSIMLLIAAFIFFAVALMFIIRYVILILVLILSPLAFIAFVLPQLEKYKAQWIDALVGQAFFAPIYFMLTWVTLHVLGGITSAFGATDNPRAALSGIAFIDSAITGTNEAFGLLINFIVVIVFLVASLILAKELANKVPGGVNKLTGWATGVAGGASFGLAGRAGRYTLGAATEMAKESKAYKRLEAASPNSRLARLTLAAADKTSRASFDARGGKLGGILASAGIEGGKAQEGGFEADRKAVREFLERPGTESHKKRQERAREAQNELDIVAGVAPGATNVQIYAMERALAGSSDKEIEAIVDSNRKLLGKQEFANRISVKQLEALNKSDRFCESEKDELKRQRFEQIKTIHDTAALLAYTAASAVPVGARSATQIADIKRVDDARARIKGLSDTELEMIDPMYFDTTRPEALEFISQLSSRQAETITINKNGKFTSTQKENVKKQRIKPLMTALSFGVAAEVRREMKKIDIKTKVSYMKINGPGGTPIALDSNGLDTYDIKTLQRMALHENMTDGDISTLRGALLARLPVGNPVRIWLEDASKGVIEFPA